MLGHDMRHTGQSELLGPDFSSGAPAANQVSAVPFVDKIKMHPVVGQNGDVYVGMGWQFCSLKALDVSNPANPVFLPNTAWNSPARSDPGCQPTNADVSASSAAIDQNGYIYFGDRDNSVYKFRGSDGQRMWTYNHGHEGDHHSSPAIAADGTVYFVFSQNTDGKWLDSRGQEHRGHRHPATRGAARLLHQVEARRGTVRFHVVACAHHHHRLAGHAGLHPRHGGLQDGHVPRIR